MLWTEKLVLFPNSPPGLCGHRKVRVCASEGGNWASPPELLNNRSHHITACQTKFSEGIQGCPALAFRLTSPASRPPPPPAPGP